jgi:hypothetical protein
MSKNKWTWKAGRLVKAGTDVSFSIDEAYHWMPVHDDIAKACEDVLIDYKEDRDRLRDLL